ncbi:MAG: geranylgeranylglyceryl/heptaprenylglyceryl phosphate synthase [Saprospiraceae bacterium]|nr:geranylgeranylglyceryl/heptaprenylglyceryl phosphate synthase [Saprospiraceae bacterium]
MRESIYLQLIERKAIQKKSFAVLIDPDHLKINNLETIIKISNKCKVDYFFIGGSLILQDRLEETLRLIKENSLIPTVLFPGNGFQISNNADALLFLSLVSGRNPEYLIGKQIEAAPKLRMTSLEIISTAYMLIDGMNSNTASYISQTQPIPHNKPEVALATALAAQYLGFKTIFMDAGSGAKASISTDMVQRVAQMSEVPLIIGGGITSGQKAKELYQAGADLIVIGNAIEKDPSLIAEITSMIENNALSENKQLR